MRIKGYRRQGIPDAVRYEVQLAITIEVPRGAHIEPKGLVARKSCSPWLNQNVLEIATLSGRESVKQDGELRYEIHLIVYVAKNVIRPSILVEIPHAKDFQGVASSVRETDSAGLDVFGPNRALPRGATKDGVDVRVG